MSMPKQSSTTPHALTRTKQAQGYIVAEEVFRTKQELTERIHNMLFSYEVNAIVAPKDEELLLALLVHHPHATEKIGAGIKRVRVKTNRLYANTRYFWLERLDGSGVDFSYHKCIRPVSRWEETLHALRIAIQPQIMERKMRVFGDRSTVKCPVTDKACTWEGMHVDHRPPLTFAKLVQDFLIEQKCGAAQIELVDASDFVGKVLGNIWFAEAWADYHRYFADLWVISIEAHVALTRERLLQRKGGEV